MEWDVGRLLLDKEEVAQHEYNVYHIGYDDYSALSDSYGHKNMKLVLAAIADSFPKHHWIERENGSFRHDFAYRASRRVLIRHWKSRAQWASKAFDLPTGLLRDSLWFASLRADSEGLDGIVTVELMVHHWGIQRTIDLTHRKVPMSSLVALLGSDIDADLVDSLLGLQTS